jgi:predicted ATPase
MRQGMRMWQGTGAKFLRPYWLALLVETEGKEGLPQAGLPVLAEALEVVGQTGERWWETELHRLQGELFLKTGVQQEAEECFRQALDLARRQSAKSLELRAVMSLARLWQQQGKKTKARELLAPVYNWFTEGFDTADLIEAKALLDAIA